MKEPCAVPVLFSRLLSLGGIDSGDLVSTDDGFYCLSRSLSDILLRFGITDFPDEEGRRLRCDRFFDDWYIYAVSFEEDCVYSLFKLREQEYDAREDAPADGDTPGVTVSFVSLSCQILLSAITDPTDDNLIKATEEIDRVVAFSGQRHHRALKKYFTNPASLGSYTVASLYVRHIASFARDGYVETPVKYRELYGEALSFKKSAKARRLFDFIDSLNLEEGRTVCDHKRIYITCAHSPTEAETAAILATHTGNVSVYSFAAEVEYHARFLIPPARLKLPFFGRSIYESAIRADMTVDDTEFEGPAPFYRNDSRIVRRQTALHRHR